MTRYSIRGEAAIIGALSVCLTLPAVAQESGWQAFAQGDIRAAASWSRETLEIEPDNHGARHLRLLTSYLSGDYQDALAQQILLPVDYSGHDEALTRVVLNAYLNLGRYQEAVAFSRRMQLPEAERVWLERRAAYPPTVQLQKTTIVPFAADNFLGDLMPAVEIELNGVRLVAHLDTGGAFVTMSPSRAEELGIVVHELGEGVANNRATSISRGYAESMRLGDAVFTNVQVSTVDSLQGPQTEKLVILGTRILSEFLVTWDNQASRLVFSPRGDESMRDNHLSAARADVRVADFFMHSDHYLWVHGTVAGHRALMFFDTGLVTLDPRGNQPAGGIVAQKAEEWGLATNDAFTEPVAVSVGTASRERNSFSVFADDRNFASLGDLRPDVLISHGFFKNYTWTLDFDTRKLYMRPVDETPISASDDSNSVTAGLDAYAGSYEVAPGVNLEVTVGEQGLLLQAPGQQRVPMTHGSAPDTFEITLAGATIEFGRDDVGEVASLLLRQAGNETRAQKVR